MSRPRHEAIPKANPFQAAGLSYLTTCHCPPSSHSATDPEEHPHVYWLNLGQAIWGNQPVSRILKVSSLQASLQSRYPSCMSSSLASAGQLTLWKSMFTHNELPGRVCPASRVGRQTDRLNTSRQPKIPVFFSFFVRAFDLLLLSGWSVNLIK